VPVEQRTPGRARDDGRISKAAVKKATLVVLAEFGRRSARSPLDRRHRRTAPARLRNFSPNNAAKGMCRHMRHSDSLA